MITIKNTYWHLYAHVVSILYTSRDRETYTDTTTATDRDIHDIDTELVRTCIYTASNSMALSALGLVLWLWWCSSSCRFQKVARSSACRVTSDYRGDIRGVRRGYLWGYSCSMPAKSGRGASDGGSGRLQAALARGGGGAPGGRSQQLVDAIIELGYLPTQSKHSTVAEKQLAVRLIKARKACSLSSKQEAALENLAQGAAQHLVDIIIELGYLPTQSKNSTLEEKQLAVRLIKA